MKHDAQKEKNKCNCFKSFGKLTIRNNFILKTDRGVTFDPMLKFNHHEITNKKIYMLGI